MENKINVNAPMSIETYSRLVYHKKRYGAKRWENFFKIVIRVFDGLEGKNGK